MSDKPDLAKNALENITYGYKRIDVLVIVISILGINSLANNPNLKQCLFKFSYLFFVLTIITNLISQYTSTRSNTLDYQSIITKKDAENTKEDGLKELADDLDERSHKLSEVTKNLTFFSAIFMVLGLLLLLFGSWRSW